MNIVKTPFVRSLRYAALRASARGAVALARSCPRKPGLALFGLLGSLVYLVPHADRTRTISHLTLIYGDRWDRRKINRTARDVYRQLGKNIFDAFLLPRISPKRFNRIVTYDPIDAVRIAYDKKRGCIMITAHTGCFEMLLHFFAFHGFRSFAIGKKLHDDQLDAIMRDTRSGDNIVYMDRSESPRKMIRYLQEGMIFGILIDQDTSVEGVFARFLGRPAYTPSGPVKMAMKLDVPVFVVTTARQPDDTHHVYITGPVPLKTGGDFESDLVDNVTAVNDIICATIDRHPSQWVWMHRRWHRQPEPPPVMPQRSMQ